MTLLEPIKTLEVGLHSLTTETGMLNLKVKEIRSDALLYL